MRNLGLSLAVLAGCSLAFAALADNGAKPNTFLELAGYGGGQTKAKELRRGRLLRAEKAKERDYEDDDYKPKKKGSDYEDEYKPKKKKSGGYEDDDYKPKKKQGDYEDEYKPKKKDDWGGYGGKSKDGGSTAVAVAAGARPAAATPAAAAKRLKPRA